MTFRLQPSVSGLRRPGIGITIDIGNAWPSASDQAVTAGSAAAEPPHHRADASQFGLPFGHPGRRDEVEGSAQFGGGSERDAKVVLTGSAASRALGDERGGNRAASTHWATPLARR